MLATAAVVAWIACWAAHLPTAAGWVLGAIVAPSDAAAAVAVLGAVSLPRRTISVLKGESLFNDAMALLLFNGALMVQARGGFSTSEALQMAIAIPGGVVFGVAFGAFILWIGRFVSNTLGGNLLQFLNAFLVWILAERLQLSPVLATVACAMTVAQSHRAGGSPRMRVHSFAVWASVVFVLNVLAFLLMGMQARLIIARMSPERLRNAARVAVLVIAAVVVTRFLVVMGWNRLATRFHALRGQLPAPKLSQSVAVGWSGMRGLLTLATAFALPGDFPQRDIVVLAAFAVVLATLVLQGLTLAPLIRWLKLDRMEDPAADLRSARRALAARGLAQLQTAPAGTDMPLSEMYRIKSEEAVGGGDLQNLSQHRRMALGAIQEQRTLLRRLRDDERVDTDIFYQLQEELDWRELTLLPDDERRILDT